jgi:hypothetical protein
VRASLNQRREDFLEHIIRPLQHFVIPEPNHAKSTARQILRPLDVVQQIVRVPTSVDFNNEPCTKTDEIHDVIADRLLSPESVISKMPVTQMPPQATFGVGGISA